MIHSMTGFGKADAHFSFKKIHIEIKSLNSKNLDINARIAPGYHEKEMEIRQMISARLQRGKVDFTLWTEKESGHSTAVLNSDAIKSYRDQIKVISSELGISEPENYWDIVLRLPETSQNSTIDDLSDEEWAASKKAVDEAIDNLVEFRAQEGAALYEKFMEKADNIEHLLGQLEPYEQHRIDKIYQRMKDHLEDIKGVDYDKNRLEQEMIYYVEKLDISEEKQRLTNHLKYFRETLDLEPGQGKKLGFIAQEMGREINTTGSKSNLAEMQNIVVKMKDELEQIKEQVLNVL
ncbi:YicC family protein [Pseudoprevotella muciniphila]|uniref:YicC family protein n=1 Tax=Pseudoprevotella muciniphila TaxID=2133944 RepID=A0A5P8E472_9BACT|nr:YicC/YloC family endoribonuclease [Pseudoprevotella muciniphila]QFQ11700.1 YicC family protein [Pseudoprevotella muciniphila]